MRATVEDLLADARRGLIRLDAASLQAAMREGAVVIDIRGERQIEHHGLIPGALVIPRNVLEWRLDPSSAWRHPRAPALEDLVAVVCEEGYQSSLVAATLQQLGFTRATDLVGGFRAWLSAGLPVAWPDGRTAGEARAPRTASG